MARKSPTTEVERRARAKLRAFPWLVMEKRRPTDADAPPPTPFPGPKVKVVPAQLTLTQAEGYDPAA